MKVNEFRWHSKATLTAKSDNEIFMDLSTSEEPVPMPGTTITEMVMTPKSRAAEKPQASHSSEHAAKMTPKQDPHILRLQQDLNSPSAAVRIRAMRALKSPNKAAYNNFDVPHDEQSIITEEERNPSQPPTLSEILQDVVVYVEVRTGNDNRSEGVKTIIAKMGAKINDRLLRNTTHVVFKDGLLSSYKRAESWNIPIVSILWIEACKVQRRLCEPKQFPISNIHMYQYPELYGKVTRVRCMQPDSELNKRPRKRQGTPTNAKDKESENKRQTPTPSTPTSTPKNNDLLRYFKPLSQNKQLRTDEVTESPATNLLNRISNGCFTLLQMHAKQKEDTSATAEPNKVESNGNGDVTRPTPTAQRNLNYSQEKRGEKPRSSSLTVEPTQAFIPANASRRRSSLHGSKSTELSEKVQSEPRLTRRRSLLNMSNKSGKEEIEPQPLAQPETPLTRRRRSLQVSNAPTVENESQPMAQPEPIMTRRRSLLQLTSAANVDNDPKPPAEQEQRVARRRISTILTDEPCTPKLLKKPSFETIAEEPINNNINCEQPPLDMEASKAFTKNVSNRNKTNLVQQSMEMSPSRTHIASKATGRRTLYTTDRMEISEVNDENVNPYVFKKNSLLANVTTQTSLDSFEEHTPTPVFSSTRLPSSRSSSNRRRTLFSVDMELINERINVINSTSQRRSLALANEAELGECPPLAPLQAVAVDAPGTAEPKKRRLFTPNEEVVVSPPISAKKSRQSLSSRTSSSDSVKRRRTLGMLKPTAAVGPTVQNDFDSNAESDAGKDVFVTPFGSTATIDSASESQTDAAGSTSKRRIIHTLVHTNMHKEQVQVIHKAIRKLGRMRLDPTVTKRTTHLVSLEPRRTLNLLRGLMRGVWIVSYKWILESLRAGKWLDEEQYELTSFSRAVEICRTERQAFGESYRCELFRYMESFYVSSLCRPITFNNIKELLLLGGAKLSDNRYRAKYIVGDKRRAEDDRIYLSPAWVLDSITAMQIQKFNKYLMKCVIVTPHGIRYEDPCEKPDKVPQGMKICYKDPVLVMNK